MTADEPNPGPEGTLVVRERRALFAELPEPGAIVGSYRLLAVQGEGAVGRVYLAEHTRLGRRVALKMLRPEFSHHPKAIERFFGEARAVNRIAHDNIVVITDFYDEGEYPAHYIMELLEGMSLAERLEAVRFLDPGSAIAIARQLASTLAAVHAMGIVHRDLKPANIYLTRRGAQADFVKLLDFGVAKLSKGLELQGVGGNTSGSTIETKMGALIGTPRYMSPEQAQGLPVDARSDLYALGVILYEMLVGHPPFRSDDLIDVLAMHQVGTPLRPSELPDAPQVVPPDLEALIMELLCKLPSQRPQTAEVLLARLDALQPGPRPRRSWAPAMIFGVLASLGLAAAGAVWSGGLEPKVSREPRAANVEAPPPRSPEVPLDPAPAPLEDQPSREPEIERPEITEPTPSLSPTGGDRSAVEGAADPKEPPSRRRRGRRRPAPPDPPALSAPVLAPAPRPAPAENEEERGPIDTAKTLNPFGGAE